MSFSFFRRNSSLHPIDVVCLVAHANAVFLGCSLSKPQKLPFMYLFEAIIHRVYLFESISPAFFPHPSFSRPQRFRPRAVHCKPIVRYPCNIVGQGKSLLFTLKTRQPADPERTTGMIQRVPAPSVPETSPRLHPNLEVYDKPCVAVECVR